jgi:hypothetical protein
MAIGSSVRVILGVLPKSLRDCIVGITDDRDFLCTPLKWAQVALYNYQSFMKIGTGVQAILRFYLSSLNVCNVGIIDGRDL